MTTIIIGNGIHKVDEGVLTGSTLIVGDGFNFVTLDAGSTDDTIVLGNGVETLNANNLSDSTITAGYGYETIIANGNDDSISVKGGVDTITANGAGDTIAVGDGSAEISTGSGASITIGNGAYFVFAGANSTVGPGPHGDNGWDTVIVGPDSTVKLGDGVDTVFAGANSTITVGNAFAFIHAGTSDTITIGWGADAIRYDGLTPEFTVPASLSVYEDHEADYPGTTVVDSAVSTVALPITIGPPALGNEVIVGFRPFQDVIALDKADFPNYAAVWNDASQVGANTVITLDPTDSITLVDVSKSSLTPWDFTFFNGASDVITVTGVPLDETLSAGTNNGGGSWTLTPAQLPGLQLNAGEPIGYPTPVDLTVTATNPSGQGASASETIPLVVNPVPPFVGVSVLAPHAGDPVTETRLDITAVTDDPDLVGGIATDYINRIQLSNVPTDVSLSEPTAGFSLSGPTLVGTTDDYTITDTSGNLGTVMPEVDVFAPSGQSTNFNLGVTAYSDEPNSPEVSSSTQQNIAIDYSTQSQNLDFTSTNQSIWTSGATFSDSFDNFLGFTLGPYSGSKGFSLSIPVIPFVFTTTVSQRFGGTVYLKAGFQSDLNVNGGSFNGTLPFNVAVANTYNKTNNTLEIDPTDSQLGGGSFTTTGPSGSYDLTFILDAFAQAYTRGSFGSLTLPLGPYNESIPLLNKKSSTLNGSFKLPDGIGTVAFQWPQVNTTGSNPNPGDILGQGTSPKPIFNVNIDPIAVVLDAILGGDPFKGTFLGGVVKYTLLAATLNPGVDLEQAFNLNPGSLSGMLTNGLGSNIPFSFGTPVTLDDPKNTNFSLQLSPDATLSNETSLAGQIVLGLKALAGDIKLTIDGVGPKLGFGPLFHPTTVLGPAPFATLYKNTFPVAFSSQNVHFTAT